MAKKDPRTELWEKDEIEGWRMKQGKRIDVAGYRQPYLVTTPIGQFKSLNRAAIALGVEIHTLKIRIGKKFTGYNIEQLQKENKEKEEK